MSRGFVRRTYCTCHEAISLKSEQVCVTIRLEQKDMGLSFRLRMLQFDTIFRLLEHVIPLKQLGKIGK
jgi:hypothetical protein